MASPITGGHIELPLPDDINIERDRASRHLIALATILAILAVPTLLVRQWDVLAGGSGVVGAIIGFIIGAVSSFIVFANKLLINNEEFTGYVTQDPFTGELVAYGPGWCISFPWEERNADGTLSLELMSQPIELTAPTKGSSVTLQGLHQYARSLRNLTKAARLDSAQVEKDLLSLIKSVITVWCVQRESVEEVIQKLAELNGLLADMFVEIPRDDPQGFEVQFGIENVGVTISGITLPPALQKTRDAEEEGKRLFNIVARMLGLEPAELKNRVGKEISYKEYREMLNRAMAASENGTTMVIHVIEGEAPPGVSVLLGEGRQGGKKRK